MKGGVILSMKSIQKSFVTWEKENLDHKLWDCKKINKLKFFSKTTKLKGGGATLTEIENSKIKNTNTLKNVVKNKGLCNVDVKDF